MKRQLIVNADDFGLTKGVNKGIMKSHLEGIVTSTTLMVNTPGFTNAVQLSRKYPSLGIGFHFNLTYGAPLLDPAEVPSLVGRKGSFHPISLKALLSWKKEDVRNELEAQWKKVKLTNIPITHIDSHHYIQSHPIIQAEMIRLAVLEDIPMRLSLSRWALLHSCMIANKQEIVGHYPLHTDHFVADTYFTKQGLCRLTRYLQNMEEGVTELNCHPGYVDEELRFLSKWTDKREREIAVLTNLSILKLLESKNIELVHYNQFKKQKDRLRKSRKIGLRSLSTYKSSI